MPRGTEWLDSTDRGMLLLAFSSYTRISLVLPGELRHGRVHLVHVLLPYFDYEVCITPLIPWKKKKRLINSVY